MNFAVFAATLAGYAAALDLVQRPQEPRQRDYVIEHVQIPGGAESVFLDAEISLPDKDGTFPGIVLITGSGPQDKNETMVGHKPFLVLSDYLTRRGYAVLRYDDRGVAKSTGSFETATAADLAMDASTALRFLKNHPRVDPERSGYLGHSEGGYIAPLAAEGTPGAFHVYLASPALPLLPDVMRTQVKDIHQAEGEPLDTILKEVRLVEKLTEILKTSTNVEQVEQAVTPLLKAHGATDRQINENVSLWATPWALGYAHYKPAPALKALDVPVLALFGGTDLQVSARENAPVMATYLSHPFSKVLVLPGHNHLFQPSATGRVSDYLTISTTIAPQALSAIANWLDQIVQ